jgi:hypothetical protein
MESTSIALYKAYSFISYIRTLMRDIQILLEVCHLMGENPIRHALQIKQEIIASSSLDR